MRWHSLVGAEPQTVAPLLAANGTLRFRSFGWFTKGAEKVLLNDYQGLGVLVAKLISQWRAARRTY